MVVKVFYEDIPDFTGDKKDFEKLIFKFRDSLEMWKRTQEGVRPIPKYPIIYELLDYGQQLDFELLPKRDSRR